MSEQIEFEPGRTRFEAKVNKNGPMPAHCPELGPCHLWVARLNRNGYGTFDFHGKNELAHRVGFFLANGRWPEPCALHHCDNPPCVNDAHLFEGTNADNNHDRSAKGRSARQRGEYNGRARLTERDVLDIRAEYARGGVAQTALARRFGVNHRTIGVIVRREKWVHV